jgi:hypothetical protein
LYIKNFDNKGEDISVDSVSFGQAEKKYIDKLEKEVKLLTLKFIDENKLEANLIENFIEKIENKLVIEYITSNYSTEKYNILS